MLKNISFILIIIFLFQNTHADMFWLEMKAENKWQRTQLVEEGYDIVGVEEDRVIVLANEDQLKKAHISGKLLAQYQENASPFDFPSKDEKFHNYTELTEKIKSLVQNNSQIATLTSIGKSVEGRDIWSVRVSTLPEGAPGAVFMGGHHAREHVSVEVPLRLLQYLIEQFNAKNPRIVALLSTYEVHIIPVVNPDGKEFDVATGNYKMWRKNRAINATNDFGVDLNRNYGFGWGGPGASTSTKDETYRGPKAFSEPETQTIKAFVESHLNLKMLLSYHTFSQLVLWPWGHQDDDIANTQDLAVFQKAGKKMATWNGYKPMKSGDLYLASGDTCDWAYGEHGIFAFTFELDPKGGYFGGGGGFYPGQDILDSVFQKNIEPALYMIEISDNPYKVLDQ